MTNIDKNKKLFGKTFLALLERELYVDVPVFGLSMFPFFLPGDIVRIIKVEKNNLRKGDVVVFEISKDLVLHRLIKIGNDDLHCITKGDGLLKRDVKLQIEDIKGVVKKQYRKGKEIKITNLYFFRYLVAIFSPFTGYLFYPFGRIWFKYFN